MYVDTTAANISATDSPDVLFAILRHWASNTGTKKAKSTAGTQTFLSAANLVDIAEPLKLISMPEVQNDILRLMHIPAGRQRGTLGGLYFGGVA
ncbi:hypothetical protein CCHR01_18419 [Colletotrichum chrysophilum]|uniref:Uncharacterized protein n=1 Tax=Colletotrichum chrysophilum TaxID=1836956 RepID=A0AAD9A0S5_9PEZI|nr:hypothetical protein CCHR01_18419 [Colletotrichum chrysophilum]